MISRGKGGGTEAGVLQIARIARDLNSRGYVASWIAVDSIVTT